MADTMLDIVDDHDNVIGQALRHRVIHVWFITPEKEIILQVRSMSKDVDPGLLTMAVGGHVEGGANYDDTVAIEIAEETGIVAERNKIIFLATRIKDQFDPLTNSYDYERQNIYGFVYDGSLEDLKIEAGDSEGYVFKTWQEMTNPSAELIAISQPGLVDVEFPMIADKLERLVS